MVHAGCRRRVTSCGLVRLVAPPSPNKARRLTLRRSSPHGSAMSTASHVCSRLAAGAGPRAPPLCRARPPNPRAPGLRGRPPRQRHAEMPSNLQTSMQAFRAKRALWNSSSQPTAPRRRRWALPWTSLATRCRRRPPAARLLDRCPARPHTHSSNRRPGHVSSRRARGAPAPPPLRAHPRLPFRAGCAGRAAKRARSAPPSLHDAAPRPRARDHRRGQRRHEGPPPPARRVQVRGRRGARSGRLLSEH